MDEEEDVGDVEAVGFGEGEGLAGEASHTPAQGGIEAFEVVGVLLFGLLMKLFGRDGVGVSFLPIRETQAFLGTAWASWTTRRAVMMSRSPAQAERLSGIQAIIWRVRSHCTNHKQTRFFL